MSDLITISNGQQFFRIPRGDLAVAKSRGFYQPHERGHTIISDGADVFEIHVRDLSAACAEGFRDVLVKERGGVSVEAFQARTASSGEGGTPGPTPNANPGGQGNASDLLPEAKAIVSEFEQAESEINEELEELYREVEEAEGWRKLVARVNLWWYFQRVGVLRHLRGSGVSVAVHMALLLLLASFLLASEDKDPPGLIVVMDAEEEAFEEEFIEPVEMQVDEPVEEEVEPVSEQPEIVTDITETIVATDFAESLTGNLLAMPEPGGAKSDGKGDSPKVKPAKANVKFFGSKTYAVNFVFVIDNSNSMTRGRFETALNELVKAVMQLNARQKFYVIFYSDTAYPLFYPYAAKQLVPATTKNKEILIEWLKTVELCLQTRGKEALELGFSLKPDVMFVLGDGAFTDNAANIYAKNPVPEVVVHTLGMEVAAAKAVGFANLAKAHNGTYRDVGVHPAGAQMAKAFPRKKNNSHNGIWGIKLGNRKK